MKFSTKPQISARGGKFVARVFSHAIVADHTTATHPGQITDRNPININPIAASKTKDISMNITGQEISINDKFGIPIYSGDRVFCRGDKDYTLVVIRRVSDIYKNKRLKWIEVTSANLPAARMACRSREVEIAMISSREKLVRLRRLARGEIKMRNLPDASNDDQFRYNLNTDGHIIFL